MSVLFIVEWDRRRDRSHRRAHYLWDSAGCRTSLCWPTTITAPLHCQLLPLQVLQGCQAALITQEIELENSHSKYTIKMAAAEHCSHPFAHQLPPGSGPPGWAEDQAQETAASWADLVYLARFMLSKSHLCLCCCQRRWSPPSWWALFLSSSLVSSIHTHTHNILSQKGPTRTEFKS